MDLSQLNLTEGANKGAEMTVLHPITGDVVTYNDVPVTISLLGRDSDQFRKVLNRQANKKLGRQIKPNAEKIIEDSIEMLVACTTGWYGIEENGAVLEFNEENVRSVYTKYWWLRQQADEFVADRANFFKA